MKISVNILTKNRSRLLSRALSSIASQTFLDYELVVVNDGSTDDTEAVLKNIKMKNFKIINHKNSAGITASRQEALSASLGEYVAVLDDDDEWLDPGKLAKQARFLDEHKNCMLVGGGIRFQIPDSRFKPSREKFRAETDADIRKSMLFRNNFFTSTVMFRREAAIRAGGFIQDTDDLAEDYDLWLRLGEQGQMYNFQEAFALYRQPNYNKEKFGFFLKKQLRLAKRHKDSYPGYGLAKFILSIRLLINAP